MREEINKSTAKCYDVNLLEKRNLVVSVCALGLCLVWRSKGGEVTKCCMFSGHHSQTLAQDNEGNSGE